MSGVDIAGLVEDLRKTRTPGAEFLCLRAADALLAQAAELAEAGAEAKDHWLGKLEAEAALKAAREAALDEALAAIDALKGFVPVQGDRSRFSIYDLTRAFKAGISMAREDVAALADATNNPPSDPGTEQREAVVSRLVTATIKYVQAYTPLMQQELKPEFEAAKLAAISALVSGSREEAV